MDAVEQDKKKEQVLEESFLASNCVLESSNKAKDEIERNKMSVL